MRIVAVTWYDTRHPEAGGAEVHLHELLRRLVHAGDKVTLIVSGTSDMPSSESVDGVRVMRVGPWWKLPLVVPWAISQLEREEHVDVVIEYLHNAPLCVPWYASRPVWVIVPHLMGLTAFAAASPALALPMYLSEQLIPLVYRACTFQALSASTANDLIGRGIPANTIVVIPPGVDSASLYHDATKRSRMPTFLYLGRVQRYKRLDVLVHAFALVQSANQAVRLVIAGDGRDRSRVQSLVDRLGLSGCVEFRGRVDEVVKRTLYQEAWATVQPSIKEGWGLTILEAAACGTPTIAADSEGLRDAIETGSNGFLYSGANAAELASMMTELMNDQALRQRLVSTCISYSQKYSWDSAARQMRSHLLQLSHGPLHRSA